MSKLLLFLTWPEAVLAQCAAKIARLFPDLRIETPGTREAVCEAIGDADILLTFSAAVTDEMFQRAKALRWVHSLGTGVDHIVDSPSLGRDVIVSSTRGIHGAPMSEMAFMMMLALGRDLPRSLRAQAARKWDRWPAKLLNGKTVGILGVGLIAETLAPRCKAFGMDVIGISRTERAVPGIDRFVRRDELNEAAASLDYLIVLAPNAVDTIGLVNAETLRAMKPTAFLINVAHGGVVDEQALADALNGGEIAGAAVDTFVEEPLPPDNPLWEAPNLIITPHLGGYNDVYFDSALPQFETNLRHLLDGEPNRMINLERR